MAQKKFLDFDGLLYFWNKVKTYTDNLGASKVDKVDGKGLSTNDYTTEEKQKLAGLNNYELPKASAETLGGIKVGAGLTIDEQGNLSATGGGEADSVNWQNVVGRPTKLSEFENDSGYQTSSDVAEAIVNKADKTYVDEQLATKSDKGHTHTKSEITDFPTAVSEFSNDANYQSDTEVELAITSKGYQTSSQVELAITSKGYQTAGDVETTLADYAKKTDISTVYKYCGSVETYADLPQVGQAVGDTYNVKNADAEHNVKAGDNLTWNGEDWDNSAGIVDLTGYVQNSDLVAITNSEIDEAIV